MNSIPTRLVAVSNRLPIILKRDGPDWQVEPGAGGLVTALAPILRNRGGLWIGWPGTTEPVDLEQLMGPASHHAGYSLRPVILNRKQLQLYYHGFANQILWPLFHDLQTICNFDPAFWYSYLEVNREFARVIGATSSHTDFVWVHDYHLMCVAQAMGEEGIRRKTGFFLHIPFPPADIFVKLPWRAQILHALLQYGLIGFQTMRDRRNFIQCLQFLYPKMKTSGRGPVISVEYEGRQIRIGSFAISIDYDAFAQNTMSTEVTNRLRQLYETLPGQTIILGVDRLDYTKGIPQRLHALDNALDRYPELRGKVTLVEVVVPSREGVPEYQNLKAEIDRLVGEINGKYTTSGWVPVHYMYHALPRDELIAYYCSAEVALLTPLKDGMNLVAKEYCACSLQGDGVLILSEAAGVAAQLYKGALMVNPYDIEGMADAIFRAVTMDKAERQRRMRLMQTNIRKYDIFWWVDSFLQAAFARTLDDFPSVEEYIPDLDTTDKRHGRARLTSTGKPNRFSPDWTTGSKKL